MSDPVNSNDPDVGYVAAALGDAAHAGGLSTSYFRSANATLKRLANRLEAAETVVKAADELRDVLSEAITSQDVTCPACGTSVDYAHDDGCAVAELWSDLDVWDALMEEAGS